MALVSLSEMKVGVFVVLALVLFLVAILSVGNFQEYFSRTVTIHITIPSIDGLEKYSPVTYSGVRIGTVKDYQWDEERQTVVIDAQVDIDSSVSLDSKVNFTSASLLSPLFISISGGSKTKRIRDLIKNGAIDTKDIYLEAEPYLSIGAIFALAGDVKNVLQKVEGVLGEIDKPLMAISDFIDDASKNVNIIMHDVDGMISDGHPRINQLLDNSNNMITSASGEIIPTLQDIRKGAKGVAPLVSNTQKQLHDVLNKTSGLIESISPELDELSDEAIVLIKSINKRIETIQSSIVRLTNDVDSVVVNNREDIDRIVAHLETTAANLNEISTELSKNPWRMIWKTEEKMAPPRVSPKWNPIMDAQGAN